MSTTTPNLDVSAYRGSPRHVATLTYVLPLRRMHVDPVAISALGAYLETLAEFDVIVADGSPPDVFAAHAILAGRHVRHVRVESSVTALNGKVSGVLTGLAAAECDRVVIADEDVRYDRAALDRMATALEDADVVRPQNYFSPVPWHAAIDTARSLLNRAFDGDWPGTLGVRRDVILRAGGYDANVLFENLELVRTVRAAGGVEFVALDLFVRRLPPSTGHFFAQRVRQAYDEFARPIRMLAMLVVLPAVIAAVGRRRGDLLAYAALSAIGAAEYGRRRAGATRVFGVTASLLAPVWILERATCVWLAVGYRWFAGGVRYSHGRIRRAATPMRTLRKRFA